jgi:drug/metabolite transporter (DMT)-like permease
MSDAPVSFSSPVAVLGLAGGFLVARQTGRRDLGGALFAAAGAFCARDWYRVSGPARAAGLSALYVAAMGGSHPLAKRIGAWPSVAVVTAVTVAAAELVTRTAGR